MSVADAWATETATVTTEHRNLAAKLAADREAYLAAGGKIEVIPMGVSADTVQEWRDFSLGQPSEQTIKRRGKRAAARWNNKEKL